MGSNQTAGRFAAAPGVLTAAEAGRTVLLDPRAGQYYTLNEVGGRIWELLQSASADADQLAAALAEEFDAPLEVLRADAADLLRDLHRAGLATAC